MGDQSEAVVLGPNVPILVAVDYTAAEALGGTRTLITDCRISRHLSVTVELTEISGPGTVFVAVRSSGKSAPDVAVPGDWSRMNRTANIDVATGIDTSLPLLENLTITAIGRHTLDLPVTNRFVSIVVWSDSPDYIGTVYTYRAE